MHLPGVHSPSSLGSGWYSPPVAVDWAVGWGVRALEVLGLRALGLIWLDFGFDFGLIWAWISACFRLDFGLAWLRLDFGLIWLSFTRILFGFRVDLAFIY